ncbi:MAG: hypothetical protein QW756_08375 [Nitrososphaerota archaeon]
MQGEEEEVYELNLSVIDTPRGKVVTLESLQQVIQLIQAIQQDSEDIRKKIENIPNIQLDEKVFGEFAEKLETLSKEIENLDENVALLIDAVQELSATVAAMKKDLADVKARL